MHLRCALLLLTVTLGTGRSMAQAAPAAQTPAPTATDWALIERVLGRAPTETDDVRKVTFPRADIRAFVGKTALMPAAAMTSWMAFRQGPSNVVTHGDLVVLSSEMPGVMDALLAHGFEVSGVHNHLAGERPQLMYVHFFAQGQLPALVAGLKAALGATATPTAPAKPSGGMITYDRKAIEAILGKTGTASGAVLAFSFPGSHTVLAHAAKMPAAMGMATVVNFQPAATGVAVTGDFALEEAQVTRVLAALRKAEVTVTAVHNHLLDDNPRMVFVHFWAEGKADKLARAIKDGLDAMR
ncbi:MAG: DUF1259 domain-containing protein [Terriglobales bacterium]